MLLHSQEWATPAGKTISSLPLAAVEEAEEEEGRGLGDVSRGEGWRGSRGEVREDSEHPPQSTWRIQMEVKENLWPTQKKLLV